MSHVPHEPAADFPELTDRIHALKTTDAHFQRLFDDYHRVNREVHRAEAAGLKAGDEIVSIDGKAIEYGKKAAAVLPALFNKPGGAPVKLAIDRDGVPQELVDKEAELLRRQAEQEGKPPAVTEKIVQGRLKKFYGEVCLLEQAFVKNPDQSVRKLLEEAGKELGEPVRVSGFVRFKLGETATE